MAAGDAQRIWYPEMLEKLRAAWRPEMTFEGMVQLRDELDAMLQQIKAERHIHPPKVKCPQCGQLRRGATMHVSVRAMILSLVRFEITSGDEAHALEKSWAVHRRQSSLDSYGQTVEPVAARAGCGHSRPGSGV